MHVMRGRRMVAEFAVPASYYFTRLFRTSPRTVIMNQPNDVEGGPEGESGFFSPSLFRSADFRVITICLKICQCQEN
jgi:hypothetical protein